MFCSRVVSSYGKTAEWPFGSSFALPSGGSRILVAPAIVRLTASPSGKGSWRRRG